jgi:uncharacterized protein YukE
MAQLSIDQASVGYDTQGIQEFITKLNLEVIGKLRTTINDNIETLRSSVDQVWAGESAEAFKTKIEKDSQTMIKTLEGIEDDVKSEFAQIAKNVDDYDKNIADSILKSE